MPRVLSSSLVPNVTTVSREHPQARTASHGVAEAPRRAPVRCTYSKDAAWLTDAQIERGEVGAADRGKVLADKRQIDALFANYDAADVEARALIDKNSGAFTPAMTAKLCAVMLTGTLHQHIADDLRWAMSGFSTSEPLVPHIPRGNLRGLHKMIASIRDRPASERALFCRAMAWELAAVDLELVERLVKNVGVGTLSAIVPELSGLDERAASAELADQAAVAEYIAIDRPEPKVTRFEAPPELASAIRAATKRLAEADAIRDPVRAREAYGAARDAFRAVVSKCPEAIRDPAVRIWMERRSRALFVHRTIEELRTGPRTGKGWRLARTAMVRLPLLWRYAPSIDHQGEADHTFAAARASELGFDPCAPLTGPQERLLARNIAEATLHEGFDDPMIAALLPPVEIAEPGSAHLVFAPGIIPIGGVMSAAFERLDKSMGIPSHIAGTGLFESEWANASQIATQVDAVLAKSPDAKIVLMGYSQGIPNILRFMDDLAQEALHDEKAQAKLDQITAVCSLYGGHNGSPAADDFLPKVRSVTEQIPGGDRLEVGLSAINRVGRFVAGGVNSLKRSTREQFWQIASLPDNIAYMGLVAHPHSESELPRALILNYRNMKSLASSQGLPEDNDTQVLACDAVPGNDTTPLGRSIRESAIVTHVRGHHWNTLSPEHVPTDPPEVYDFPKAPQAMAHVSVLAELGYLD